MKFNRNSNMQKSIRNDIYISWFILVTFYLYQYVLRISPGVLIEEIRHEFSMNADQFSLIGAMCGYGYSLMQIPVGILIDRIGIKNTALFSVFLCILGAVMLIVSNIPLVAYIGRFIGGAGAASAFMSSIKLAHDYFPKSKQGVAIGATLTFGAIGALITGKPLNYLLDQFDTWQTAFVIFAIIGVLILILAACYLPKNTKSANIHEFEANNIWKDLLKITTNKNILIYAIIAIGLYAPLSVMADLWGVAFMVKKFDMSREVASPILMNIYIGMAIGSVILPYLAQKYNILDKIIVTSALILLVLFSLVIYATNLTNSDIVILLILIGFFCGAEMLCFTAALRYTTPHTSGLTIGVVNTFNMLSGAILQQAIGLYLDHSWKGAINSKGLRIYSTEEFVEAFSILVAIIGICLVIALFTISKKHKEI